MKKVILCGIGSRETPSIILAEMVKIGQWVKEENHYLRSGHADGADWAFEEGAQDKCIIYLPWRGFNSELKSNAEKVIVENQEDYDKFTDMYHPNSTKLSMTARKLMNRNACQVLGLDLKKHSNLIVCWTKDGGPTGGTGQAIRIANAYNIPVYNMFFEELNTASKIIDRIKKKFL